VAHAFDLGIRLGELLEEEVVAIKLGYHLRQLTRALKEFIARREQKGLLEFMGKLEWDTAFDYKAERSRS
jgi:hypothetical protein